MPTARMPSQIVDVGSPLGRLRVRVAGEGPAVLLFHINRQSSLLYRELMDELSCDFCAIAMDYPSYGESEHVRQTPAIEDYAACGVAVLDALGRESAIVVGEAVGSAVAVALASNFPGRCSGMVLMNVPMMADRGAANSHIGEVRKLVAAGVEDEAAFADVDAFLDRHAKHAPMRPTLDWLHRVREAHGQCGADCWQAADALVAFDLKAALVTVDVPATLLTGEFSPFAGLRGEVESCVPDIVSAVLPDARFAIGWEKAAEVAAAIRQLRDRARAGTGPPPGG